MSTAFSSPPNLEPLAQFVLPPFPVRRFTVEQYFELARLGMLGEGDNCELLEGWIVPKRVKNPLHDNTVDILLGLLTALLPDGWFPRVQNVLQTPISAPEPDFAVTRGKRGSYPEGKDVGLVIEVADSSLQLDRRKGEIYAAAGVPRYWIINLPEQCVEVFELTGDPGTPRSYLPPRILRGNDELELILDGSVVGKIPCHQVLPENAP